MTPKGTFLYVVPSIIALSIIGFVIYTSVQVGFEEVPKWAIGFAGTIIGYFFGTQAAR